MAPRAMNHGGGEPSLASLIERSAELKRADPALAAGKQYADVLRGYLRSETIGPLPFRRPPGYGRCGVPEGPAPAELHLGRARRGLMRRRKPWNYEREPRPGISVIGARLSELVRR